MCLLSSEETYSWFYSYWMILYKYICILLIHCALCVVVVTWIDHYAKILESMRYIQAAPGVSVKMFCTTVLQSGIQLSLMIHHLTSVQRLKYNVTHIYNI